MLFTRMFFLYPWLPYQGTERKMDLRYTHLCISQGSKLFLSWLIFVLGSKEIGSWCLSTCLFSVMETQETESSFHVVPLLSEVNIAKNFYNDLTNGLIYWEYRIHWFISLTFVHTDKRSTIKHTFIHSTKPLYSIKLCIKHKSLRLKCIESDRT